MIAPAAKSKPLAPFGTDKTVDLLALLSPTPAPLKLLYADLELRSCRDLAVLWSDAKSRFGISIWMRSGKENAYFLAIGDMARVRKVVEEYATSL